MLSPGLNFKVKKHISTLSRKTTCVGNFCYQWALQKIENSFVEENYCESVKFSQKISSFREIVERINVKFEKNDFLSYQEFRKYQFRRDLSDARYKKEPVTVPNLPMLTAVSMSSNAYYMTKLAISAILRSLNSEAFVHLPAHDYLWGYHDKLFSLSRSILPLRNDGISSKLFGILAKVSKIYKVVPTHITFFLKI